MMLTPEYFSEELVTTRDYASLVSDRDELKRQMGVAMRFNKKEKYRELMNWRKRICREIESRIANGNYGGK